MGARVLDFALDLNNYYYPWVRRRRDFRHSVALGGLCLCEVTAVAGGLDWKSSLAEGEGGLRRLVRG